MTEDARKPRQMPPSGDWKTWIILGGRGSGRTYAAMQWLSDVAEASSGWGTVIAPSRQWARNSMNDMRMTAGVTQRFDMLSWRGGDFMVVPHGDGHRKSHWSHLHHLDQEEIAAGRARQSDYDTYGCLSELAGTQQRAIVVEHGLSMVANNYGLLLSRLEVSGRLVVTDIPGIESSRLIDKIIKHPGVVVTTMHAMEIRSAP